MTAKTTAMYQALQARYARLVAMGAQQMSPGNMQIVLDRFQDLQKWATQPITAPDPDLPMTTEQIEKFREEYVMKLYRELMPEMEKLERRIRDATPGGLPEERLIMPSGPTTIPAAFDWKKWAPWLIGGAAVVGFLVLRGRQ